MLLLWTILLWWRPAISHYSVLLIFRRSLIFRLSEHQISALCQTWTRSQILVVEQQRRYRVHLTKKFVGATQNIKLATKSKTIQLVSNDLLGPSKRQKRRVCRDPTLSNTPSDSDTDLDVPWADDSTEEDEEQDSDCVYCAGRFSEDHNGEEWILCAKCCRWAHTLCAGLEEDFVP